MINLRFLGGGALFALLACPAQSAVIDFTDTGCSSSGTNCLIPQSYGDTASVDVSYRTLLASTGQAVGAGLFRFKNGYGDLTDVVYGGTDMTHYVAEITLMAKGANLLSLQSFDFATYNGRAAKVPISVFDLSGNLLSSGTLGTSSPRHSTLALNSAYGSGFVIRWGPDSYNVGLDNIRYDVKSPVPEPASWAMMLTGFGALGFGMRNRRRKGVQGVATAQGPLGLGRVLRIVR